MATFESSPRGEPEDPHLTHLRDLKEDEIIHHFFIDGQDPGLTIRKIRDGNSQVYSTYFLEFYGWRFGAVDVYHTAELTSIDWQGIDDRLEECDELAKIEAHRLLIESAQYIRAAVKIDSPESLVHADEFGNPF